MKNIPNKQQFAKMPGFEQLKVSLFAYPPTRLLAYFTLLLLCSLPVAAVMGQADTCYVMKQDASGFDVASRWPALNAKACELVAAFDSTDYADSFKVFGFGFYAELEYYDGYSYPQAFLDMKAEVEQESPYYLLIGRQSDHTGIFTKFWVEVKLPNTGIFSCTTEEQILALKTRILVATEFEYFKNGKIPFDFADAEKSGMEILIAHVLSLFDCCSAQNRTICEDCASFSNLKNYLEWAGYSHTNVLSGLTYTLINTNDGFFNQKVQINFFENGDSINLNLEIKRFLDSINNVFTPVKAEIQIYNSLSCNDIFKEPQIIMQEEYLKFNIILAFDDNNTPYLFINSQSRLEEGTNKRVLISIPFEGHGLDFNVLKNEISNLIGLGGCNPEIIVKGKLLSLDWKNRDYAIIVGKNAKKKIQDDVLTGYCDFISTYFPRELNKWVEFRGLIGMADGLAGNGSARVAVVDIENIDPPKYRTTDINKATSFVIYHELGHLTTNWGHPSLVTPFTPPGFMDIPKGVFHVLGTGEKLPENPDWFNSYETIEEFIQDSKKIFSPQIRNTCKKICEKF
jgi:hypothetical protein